MPSRKERFAEIARGAREKTNAELSGEISGLTRLTDEEIEKLLPTKADKENLARLMEIVSASASQNKKVASLTENIGELGSVVVRVLGVVL